MKSRVANWDRLDSEDFQLFYDFDEAKKKQSRGTESVLNALVLSLDDRFEGRQEPSADTKKALSILWSTQVSRRPIQRLVGVAQLRPRTLGVDGGRYMGAALAAIAVGSGTGNGPGTS